MIITCVGDCGVDHYLNHDLLRPGGITLNFAVHARNIFPSQDIIQVVSVVGDDEAQKIVSGVVQKYQLLPLIAQRPGKTPVQHIDHDARGEKIFVSYEEGVLADHKIGESEKKAIEQSDFVMTVLYKQIDGFFSSVINCKPKGLMAVDFMDLADYGKKANIVTSFIDKLDVAFFGLRKKDKSLIQKLQQLAKEHHKLFIITLGPDGSMAQHGSKTFTEPAVSVEKVVDTTGAGDAFAAAFVKEYLYTKDVQGSLKLGNIHAAKMVQKLGSF